MDTTHTLRKEESVCLGSSTQHEEQGDSRQSGIACPKSERLGKELRALDCHSAGRWLLASAGAPSARSSTWKIRCRAQLDCHEGCVHWYKRALCPEDDREALKNSKQGTTLFARALRHFFMQQISRCFCRALCSLLSNQR